MITSVSVFLSLHTSVDYYVIILIAMFTETSTVHIATHLKRFSKKTHTWLKKVDDVTTTPFLPLSFSLSPFFSLSFPSLPLSLLIRLEDHAIALSYLLLKKENPKLLWTDL
jgi:hypothetical protein